MVTYFLLELTPLNFALSSEVVTLWQIDRIVHKLKPKLFAKSINLYIFVQVLILDTKI